MSIAAEKRLQEAIQKADSSIEKINKRVKLLRSKLKNCRHTFYRDFAWEHDNGYGRQTRIVGMQCTSCLKVNLWKDSSWVKLEDCEF